MNLLTCLHYFDIFISYQLFYTLSNATTRNRIINVLPNVCVHCTLYSCTLHTHLVRCPIFQLGSEHISTVWAYRIAYAPVANCPWISIFFHLRYMPTFKHVYSYIHYKWTGFPSAEGCSILFQWSWLGYTHLIHKAVLYHVSNHESIICSEVVDTSQRNVVLDNLDCKWFTTILCS